MKLRAPTAGVALALVLPLLFTARAQAQHIAGATYNGTVAGVTPMSFTVSADGSGIASFAVSGNLAGDSCTFSGISATYATPIPIANESFADTTPPLTFSGSFPGVQSAQGTLRMKNTVFPVSCDTGELAWTAATTALPPDTTAPVVQLSGSAAQKALKQRGVAVVVRCPAEACTATATGSVSVPAASKVFRFKPATKQVAKGGKATLKLGLSKSALKAVKRALNARKKLSAKVSVTVTDAAGNGTTKKRSIRLKL